MSSADRRTFLKVLGGAAAATAATSMPLMRAFAEAPADSANEFFIFVHASGGWDVTLWSDPRNAPSSNGVIEPATTESVDFAALNHWTTKTDGTNSFELYRPAGSNISWGPGIGDLGAMASRLTLINGVAMNTVSHPDGTVFSSTGRHLSGGRASTSSVDTVIASVRGSNADLFPLISVNFPSFHIGGLLDPRARPLRVDSVGTVASSLERSNRFDLPEDRAAVTALLARESTELSTRAYYNDAYRTLSGQFVDLGRVLGENLHDAFSATFLRTAYPELTTGRQFYAGPALNTAFTVELLKRGKARCMSLSFGGFDTHYSNYQDQPVKQQEMFDILAALLRQLDRTAHPNPSVANPTLGAHTHIMVFSDFCRTPQINLGGGRDHFPNNSTLLISPRFRRNMVFGRSDATGLLPIPDPRLLGGRRPIAPPDILATFLRAFEIDPIEHVRDGVVVPELLA